jgi:surface antigen
VLRTDSSPRLRAVRALALGAAIFVTTAAGAASGLGFLRDSPFARFNERDFELLQAAAVEALNSRERRASRSWRNPDTGHYGTVNVLGSFTHDERTCRWLQVQNRAGNLAGEVRYSVCRTAEGGWRVEPGVEPPRRR